MKKKDSNVIIILVVLAAIFLFIAFCIKTGFLFRGIDENINDYFSFNQSDIGIKVMKCFSFLASLYFLPFFSVIVVAFFYFNKMTKTALFYFVNVLSGAALGELIKTFFGRARPLNPFENNFSFPSTHSVMAVVAYCSLAYIFWNRNRKVSYTLLVLSLLIGFSRIYLNVHWFSDVLDGFALGILIVLSCVWLFFDSD